MKKEIDLVVKSMVSGLKLLAKSIETVAEQVENIAAMERYSNSKSEESPTETETKRKPPRKMKKTTVKKTTDLDRVLKIIQKSEKGITAGEIAKKTGFKVRKVQDNIYKLKNRGKVKSVERGVFIKS